MSTSTGEPAPQSPLPVTAVPASQAERELDVLIRARYPLISVVSWEEERVMRVLGEIAERTGKKLVQWTINSGLVRWRKDVRGTAEGIRGTKDPIVALREVELHKLEGTIFVLKDFHSFLDEAPVVRGLRDLAISLRDTYSTVILLSPVSTVPPELEKDLTIVDFPMPSRTDLDVLFSEMVEEAKANPDLRIDESEESRSTLLDAAVGLTMTEAENVFAKVLLQRGRLSAKEAPDIYHEKKQIVRKSGLLEYIETDEKLDEVGGLDNLKHWLMQRRRAFHPQARKFGLPVPKGLFLLGVQGCGKSLTAKAVAQAWQMPLLRLDMGQLFGSLVGSSEENVRRATRLAESLAPAILWIDEIDKGFAGLQSSGQSDAGTTSRVYGTFITWLQEKTAPIFVIATANNVEALPPELLRQGRFDEIFFIDLPEQEEREKIFAIHLMKRKRDPRRFNLPELAKATEGFSGAEIEQAVITGLYDAFDENRDVDQEILLAAVRKTRPLSRVMAEEIDARRQWSIGRTRPAA